MARRSAPPFTRRSPLRPRAGIRCGRVICSFTFPSPHAGGSPTVPAGVHLVVLRPGCSPPETVAVHLVVPRPSSGRHDEAGERWKALVGLVDGTARGACHPRGPHPNPKVRRVWFTLDDPYVEQVWAGVIGPSALLVLRRLPMLWHEREPAIVDLRELVQSLGLGPSLARSGRTWKTIERLVGFGMAHWRPPGPRDLSGSARVVNRRQLAAQDWRGGTWRPPARSAR